MVMSGVRRAKGSFPVMPGCKPSGLEVLQGHAPHTADFCCGHICSYYLNAYLVRVREGEQRSLRELTLPPISWEDGFPAIASGQVANSTQQGWRWLPVPFPWTAPSPNPALAMTVLLCMSDLCLKQQSTGCTQ